MYGHMRLIVPYRTRALDTSRAVASLTAASCAMPPAGRRRRRGGRGADGGPRAAELPPEGPEEALQITPEGLVVGPAEGAGKRMP